MTGVISLNDDGRRLKSVGFFKNGKTVKAFAKNIGLVIGKKLFYLMTKQ